MDALLRGPLVGALVSTEAGFSIARTAMIRIVEIVVLGLKVKSVIRNNLNSNVGM